MSGFDTVIMVDWSARSAPSPVKPTADSIWIAVARSGGTEVTYHRTRDAATTALIRILQAELDAGRRTLAGFDFPFGYPRGFARAVTGADDPLGLWAWLADRIEDDADNANNRWAVAEGLNALFPGIGPFWGCPAGIASATLPAKGTARTGHGLPERRAVEQRLPRAQPCWKLYTTGSVGSQVLLGLPRLQALRKHFANRLSVSPFQPPVTPIVLAEVYPSMIDSEVERRRKPDEIKDAAQVRVLAESFHRLDPALLNRLLREGDAEEGWILGLGHEDALTALAPPPLTNDCFALPRGVDWVPVDTALATLKARLAPVCGTETLPTVKAAGRILAKAPTARIANPPAANSAVDGYGFAHDSLSEGPNTLPLTPGRAAAGSPFDGTVPPGHALRILTGAVLPEGVDTVVLDEDTATDGTSVAFHGPLRRGANTRRAGEDVAPGAPLLMPGRRLTPADLALLAATGVDSLTLYSRLRVAILSTGDEVTEGTPGPGRIADANRPMLAAILARWGHEVIDLGIAPDDAGAISERLTRGAATADAILTSGGASAGDEDHVSRLLTGTGSFALWRIALKPGRPLALGLWDDTPVFGLPGNPVAAFTCTLLFARPALSVLAGGDWPEPRGFPVPAAFTKAKKPGRREYLRARLRDGGAEVFASEGSGRISGLSWAEGLVELPDSALTVTPGTPVRFIPFESFGL